MNMSMPQDMAAFEYGFLTSRTSKILSKFMQSETYEPDDESRSILKHANLFVEKVIKGERLISGDKAGLSPSYDDLQAFNYAIGSLSLLRSLDLIAYMSNTEDIKNYFNSIHDTMVDISSEPRKAITKEKLHLVKSFFSALADLIVSEVQPDVTPEPVLFPE